jgi:uncharacterized membrane protein
MRLSTRVTTLVIATGLVMSVAPAANAIPVVSAKTFQNCTALNKVYPHGVAKKGGKDKSSGKGVTGFKVSNALYNANKKSDRDKDGVACEK